VKTRRFRGYPLVVFGNDVNDAAVHYQEAIALDPSRSLLNRQFPAHGRGWIRRTITACSGKTGGGTGKDCDEYPFNSAVQGGKANWINGRVSLKPVRSDHNQAAGRDVLQNKLYGPCRIKANGRYGVVSDPSIPRSFAICGNGRLIP
jgi:hypothetical protein